MELIKEYHENFSKGLEDRGFCKVRDGGKCSKGKCHTSDKKHFILVTNGLVIYSNHWDWNANNGLDKNNSFDRCHFWIDNLIVKEWYYDEFKFEELDEILNGNI